MKLNPPPLPYRSFSRLLPLVLLVSIWGAEVVVTWFFGDQTLAPLLSILSLTILAFFCSPRLILFVTPFFVTESYFLIFNNSDYPLVRSGTVILGGALATIVSSVRLKLNRQHENISSILGLLPIPWIQTDGTGNILSIGRAILDLLHVPQSQLIGTSFFSLFSTSDNRGEFIRLFLDAADNSTSHQNLHLSLTRPPHSHFNASISPLSTSKSSSVLIIFHPAPPPPEKIFLTPPNKT
jgi:PAS domain-containing protein